MLAFLLILGAAASTVYGVYLGTSVAGFCWSTYRMQLPEEELARCAFSAITRPGYDGEYTDPIVGDFDEVRRMVQQDEPPSFVRGEAYRRNWKILYRDQKFYRWEWSEMPKYYRFRMTLPRQSGRPSSEAIGVNRCLGVAAGGEELPDSPYKCGRLVKSTP